MASPSAARAGHGASPPPEAQGEHPAPLPRPSFLQLLSQPSSVFSSRQMMPPVAAGEPQPARRNSFMDLRAGMSLRGAFSTSAPPETSKQLPLPSASAPPVMQDDDDPAPPPVPPTSSTPPPRSTLLSFARQASTVFTGSSALKPYGHRAHSPPGRAAGATPRSDRDRSMPQRKVSGAADESTLRRPRTATSMDGVPDVDAQAVLETLIEQAERCEQGYTVSVRPFLLSTFPLDSEELDAKVAILHMCRTVRDQHKWTEQHREALHRLLISMQANEVDAMDNIETFNMTLQNDQFQHEMDVHEAMRMCFGLTCLFFACQMPWIITTVVIYFQWTAERPDALLNPLFASVLPLCDNISWFLLGFFIIYGVNVFLGVVFTLARSVDGANNALVYATPPVTGFMSLTIIAFNMYGVVVVWKEPLWRGGADVPSSCYSMLILSTSCICMFLAIPCLYYSIASMLRVTDNVTAANIVSQTEADDEAPALPESKGERRVGFV